MARPVARWLEADGMAVKSEFVTPWGICDLVGLTFDPANVERRLQLRQTQAIGSITRALLLLHIPDEETGTWTTLASLARHFAPSVPQELVSEEIARLIVGRFVVSRSRRRLQRVNGWIPLQDRLVAVELKLSRVKEAMHQALSNLGFAEESYVGFPAEVAERVSSSESRCSDFFDAGVGLLSVTPRGCKPLVPARRRRALDRADEALRFYSVEKFWRTRSKTA